LIFHYKLRFIRKIPEANAKKNFIRKSAGQKHPLAAYKIGGRIYILMIPDFKSGMKINREN